MVVSPAGLGPESYWARLRNKCKQYTCPLVREGVPKTGRPIFGRNITLTLVIPCSWEI
jgi:hypothetical protein